MEHAPMQLFTLFTLLCAVYAHYRLPRHINSDQQVWISRLALILIGIGFGWAMVRFYGQTESYPHSLIFLSAFGVVHIPAAGILFLKGVRDRPQP